MLPYGRQDIRPADVEAVSAALKGEWLTQGPTVAAFERALCEVTGAAHAVAVSSGTAALHLANLALGVGPGDVAVTSAVSFVASANGTRYCGGDVAFTDVEPDTGLMDLADLERVLAELAALGRRAKLVVPVDLAGQPADLPAVQALARRHGALVVEDAAHGLGGSYGGSRCASCEHADLAILSFHPVKHVTTGEGGAVLTRDPALAQRLRELRSHGIHREADRFSASLDEAFVGPWYYEQAELGWNYRLTDVQSALGVSQLARLPEFLARRRQLAARYDGALARFADRLRPLVTRPGKDSARHLYVVQLVQRKGEAVVELARRRKDLYHFLRQREIAAQVHYIPIPWQPYWRKAAVPRKTDYPGATLYYASSLSLPLFPAMSDADADRVIEALGEWLSR